MLARKIQELIYIPENKQNVTIDAIVEET